SPFEKRSHGYLGFRLLPAQDTAASSIRPDRSTLPPLTGPKGSRPAAIVCASSTLQHSSSLSVLTRRWIGQDTRPSSDAHDQEGARYFSGFVAIPSACQSKSCIRLSFHKPAR